MVLMSTMSHLPFEEIAPEYDKLNNIISLGLHHRWRTKLVKELLDSYAAPPSVILDIATGTGEVADDFYRMTRHHGSEVIGLDPSPAMLREAKQKRRLASKWILGSSEVLPLPSASVSLISCAYGVRNFSDRRKSFAEWKRVLAPGGIAGVLEIHPLPRSWMNVPVSLYWRGLVPLLGGLFGHTEAYRYLRDSILNFLTPKEMALEAEEAGLSLLSSKSFFACGMVTFSLFERHDHK